MSKITDAWVQLGIIQQQRFEQATGATPLRLTDAERRDLAIAADAYEQNNGDPDCERIASTLRGLLDRTGVTKPLLKEKRA